MTQHDSVDKIVAGITRIADAHYYFAENGDLRMSTGDHRAREKELRDLATRLESTHREECERLQRLRKYYEVTQHRIGLAKMALHNSDAKSVFLHLAYLSDEIDEVMARKEPAR